MKLKVRRRSTKGNEMLTSPKDDVSSGDVGYTSNRPVDFQECSLPLHKPGRNVKFSRKHNGLNCTSPTSSDDEADEPILFRSFIKNAMIQSPGDSDDYTPNVSFTDVDSDNCSYAQSDNENYMSESNVSEYDGTDDETEDEQSTQRIAIKRKTNEKRVVAGDTRKVLVNDELKVESEVASSKEINEQFTAFRLTYLIVHLAIMLADGLQGTHLYVLYEGYGYSVATLYSLGFLTGAFTSPFIGPLVDKMGRKKAAMLYCFLEMIINQIEQYPLFIGLIFSRVVGGITTNLLFSVFESWLLTEHRRRNFAEEKLETIMRDSVIGSNLAAIVSGFLAHGLAEKYGSVGPFMGAVACTGFAFLLVSTAWSENYGCASEETTTLRSHMVGAYRTITEDSKISRIGLIQGLTEGSLQTFVFLWSPALRAFSVHAASNVSGLDKNGEPAYGLLFGAFMFCGVIGGLVEPLVHKGFSCLTSCKKEQVGVNGEKDHSDVSCLCAFCYILSACLLLIPCVVDQDSSYAFSISLGAFLLYEFLVGVYMPCEGVIRSIYMPNDSICSLMTMLRVIVNVAVCLGVISTNYVPFKTAFAALSLMMLVAASLQLSLIPLEKWQQMLPMFYSKKLSKVQLQKKSL